MDTKALKQELVALFAASKDQIMTLWQNQLSQEAGQVVAALGQDMVTQRSLEIFDKILAALPEQETHALQGVRELLGELSQECTSLNLSAAETATFVLSLKHPLFTVIEGQFTPKDQMMTALLFVGKFIDKFGLMTVEAYTEAKSELIRSQQRALMEMAAPVVKVWDQILMVPLIGILDSERTQMVMDKMLSAIEATQSKIVILDITGIPTVDTLVARHLISTATAVKLMGAQCVVTGISSRIAQTIVQMGVELVGLRTKSSMADGLEEALRIIGRTIVPIGEA